MPGATVSDFFVPNPNLQPEKSKSWEATVRGPSSKTFSWRATYFDNKVDDLIVYVFPTVENVAKAHIRGAEHRLDLEFHSKSGALGHLAVPPRRFRPHNDGSIRHWRCHAPGPTNRSGCRWWR